MGFMFQASYPNHILCFTKEPNEGKFINPQIFPIILAMILLW
jgi:hypothetical protein